MLANPDRKIGYLFKAYSGLPWGSTYNQIEGLESRGFSVEIFSMERPAASPVPAPATRDGHMVRYLPGATFTPLDMLRTVLCHLMLLLGHPVRYGHALRFFLSERGGRSWRFFAQAGAMAEALLRLSLEHLHADSADAAAFVAELAQKFTGITFSFGAHTSDTNRTRKDDLQRRMKSASFVLTCTAANGKYLQSISGFATPIRVVYHGIDVQLFQPRNDSIAPGSAPLILSAGPFHERKGFRYLVEACALLRKEGRDVRCRIIGFGQGREELAELVRQLNLEDRVLLDGPVAPNEMVEAYRSADVFVLPSLVASDGDQDGIPDVILEAMAARVPVVSTGVSGTIEVIDQLTNGLLAPERDSGAIARAVGLLLDDPELRQRLAENGRRTVLRDFEAERNCSEVAAALEKYRFGHTEPGVDEVRAAWSGRGPFRQPSRLSSE